MFIIKLLSNMSKTKNTEKSNRKSAITDVAYNELMYRMASDIIEGANRETVVRKMKNDEYNMSFKTSEYADNTILRMYKEAHRWLKVEQEGDKDELRNIFYERYLNLYKNSLQANDRTNALATLKEMTRMLGLNEPEKLNIKEDRKIIIDFGFEDNGNNSETES